ncbi:HpcH/HpaI aldolase family protein [Bradyrhizobium sp. SYSU BS000235]|uniref:HpcH/HpaI aldolase family protein n=1 Tax=Bradyrhizobium sp. SYSU BS000235 TaxID=3411332 RepID=UPI003C708471
MPLKDTVPFLKEVGNTVGCFVCIPHPCAVEACALQDLDFVCIDTEHSMVDRSMVEQMVRAADVAGARCMVRVPGVLPEWIATVLDAGAGAVLVPRVSTAEDARAVVAASRFPPQGERGAGPGRAAGFGLRINDYVSSANERVLVAVQIETAAGLANVDAIAAVDGVDMLFVGPYDLELAIRAGELGTLDQAIDDIAHAAKRHGKRLGIFTRSIDEVAQLSSRTYSCFIIGGDIMFVGMGIRAITSGLRSGTVHDR